MRFLASIIASLALAGNAFAEVVDSVSFAGGTDAVLRIDEDPNAFQNDDDFTVAFFIETDALNDSDRGFSLGRDQTSTVELSAMRIVATSGAFAWLDNSSTTIDQSTAAATANVWYAICYRSTGSAGAVAGAVYEEDGDLLEDMSGTDANNGFTGAAELGIAFGARVTNGSVDTTHEGEIALMTIWTTDIGDAGCDSWADDPLNYAVTTNPADFTRLYESDGDIAGTITDQSAAAKNYTLNGSATISDEGGPTVTDFNAAPVFTVGPTEAPATNGHTISGTVTGSGTLTVYAVSTNPGAAVPNCDQIEAGDDGSNVDARVAASEVWVTGVSNNFPLTEAGNAPESDVYVCAENASGDSAVTSLTNQLRSPDASQAITELTGGLSATSMFSVQTVASCDTTSGSDIVTGCGAMAWLQPGMLVDLSAGFADLTNIIAECVSGSDATCASGEIRFENLANATSSNITVTQDAYYTPTVASDDTVEGNTTTSGGGAITVGADGEVSCAGSCSGFQTWTYNIQDVSNATTGNFSSGPPNWGTDDTLYIGSTRPLIDAPQNFYLFYEGVALADTTIVCSDADAQATSVTSRTSAPTGTSIATSGAWTGTPTVEDEVGTSLTIDCADTGLLYGSPRSLSYFVTDDEIVTPDVVEDSEDEAEIAMSALRPWIPNDGQLDVSFACSETVGEGLIISQGIAAMMTISATDPLEVVLSLGSEEDAAFDSDSFDVGSFDVASFAFGGDESCAAGAGGGGSNRARLSIGIGIGL